MQRPFNTYYIEEGMRPNEFFPRGFGDPTDRLARVQHAARQRLRPDILETLISQNSALPPSPSRQANLEALARGGAAVVATGQQVGLFLGPLYTVYKAASAIAIARMLGEETGVPCVPLFWLQTEDHDFAEIASCLVPLDDSPALRLSLHETPGDDRRSLADRTLGPETPGLVEELGPAISGLPAAADVLDLLRTHYRPGVSPGAAFAGVLASLFAEDGLIVFDPRCTTAARAAAPLLGRSFQESERIEKALMERGAALRAAGHSEQIEPRPGSPLAFFHPSEARGPRWRLTRSDGGFALPSSNETVALGELLSISEREPLRFSTSALLRPLVQDTLLPTAVYVGGPAELAYFAQLGPLYKLFDLEMPLIVERAHFTLVPSRIRGLLLKLGLSVADFNGPRDALLRKVAPGNSGIVVPEISWAAELDKRLSPLKTPRADLDPKLARAVERTEGSIHQALERLGHRFQSALLERDRVLTQRLTRIEQWLRPEGSPQERAFSFPAFAARVGWPELRRRLFAAIDPLSPGLREIDL